MSAFSFNETSRNRNLPLAAASAQVAQRRALGRLAVRAVVRSKAIARVEQLGQNSKLNRRLMGQAQQVVRPVKIGRNVEKIGRHLNRGHDDLHGRSPRWDVIPQLPSFYIGTSDPFD